MLGDYNHGRMDYIWYNFVHDCRYFTWKIGNFDDLQIPLSSIFFDKVFYASYLPVYKKGVRDFIIL